MAPLALFSCLFFATLHQALAQSADADSAPDTRYNGAKHPYIKIAHATIGATTALAVLPLGVLIARYGRSVGIGRAWIHWHTVFQGVAGLAMIVATYVLGYYANDDHLDDRHKKTGLAILTLTIVQVIFGHLTHLVNKRRFAAAKTTGHLRRRTPLSYFHILGGIALIGLLYSQVWTGMVDEWDLGHVNVGWKVGWGVAIGLFVLAYILGLIFLLPRQLRNEGRNGAPHLDDKPLHQPAMSDQWSHTAPSRQDDGAGLRRVDETPPMGSMAQLAPPLRGTNV